MSLDANNRYMLGWAVRATDVLDYGCGPGDLVEAARARGVNACGTEKFHIRDHANIRAAAERLGPDVFRELDGDRIPWPDDSFDMILSNQVFEHVEDIEIVLSEITRVLRPGGRLVALFPTSETIREGHIGVPFSHWFKPGRARLAYTTAARRVGLGRYWADGGQAPREWALDTLGWIDTYVRYRPRKQILRLLEGHGYEVRPIEEDYAAFRLGKPGTLDRPVVRNAVRAAIRRAAGVGLVAELGHAQ